MRKTSTRHRIRLAARACMITWMLLFTAAALHLVCMQAVVCGYVREETMLSVRREAPLRTQVHLFGEVYDIDWSPLNAAVGQLQPYVFLLPAPLRLPHQLLLRGEEWHEQAQKERRAREFIENI